VDTFAHGGHIASLGAKLKTDPRPHVHVLLEALSSSYKDRRMQGDQIGRIFSNWASVYLGQFFLRITVDTQFMGIQFTSIIFKYLF
jgi:hypothetical protein